MRRNSSTCINIHNFDHVYIDLPKMPHIRRIYAFPLKTVYYNRAAWWYANCDRMFRSVEDIEDFCERHGVMLP